MINLILYFAVIVIIFVSLLFFAKAGIWLGKKRKSGENKLDKKSEHGLNLMEGAVLTLMGLLFAFTFAGAENRYDARRNLVVEEVNAIRTAYLRIELLPAAFQENMRQQFKNYVDARIKLFKSNSTYKQSSLLPEQITAQENFIWQNAIIALQDMTSPAPHMLFLDALNHMFDTRSARNIISTFHEPTVIFVLLIALAITACILSGYYLAGNKNGHLLHKEIMGFVLLITLTLYTILDFEYPEVGLIYLHEVDEAMMDVRKSMD